MLGSGDAAEIGTSHYSIFKEVLLKNVKISLYLLVENPGL